MGFTDILEAVDTLSLEEQEEIAAVLHRRVVEQRRQQIAEEAREAQEELEAGGCSVTTADELMKEIM